MLDSINFINSLTGYRAEVGALFTTVPSIRVGRVSRVRVTLTVTVRVSRVSVMVRGVASHPPAEGARIEAPKAPIGVGNEEGVSPPQPTRGSGGAL